MDILVTRLFHIIIILIAYKNSTYKPQTGVKIEVNFVETYDDLHH